MKELVFRMTKTQLDTVASQMAGNGPECVMVAECGAGNTTWVSGVERSSWSFQSIIETTTMFEFSIRPLEPEPGRFCVFAGTEECLRTIAISNDSILWGYLQDGHPQVFSCQSGVLTPVNVCSVLGHDLYFRFDGKDPMVDTDTNGTELFERTLQAFGRGTTHYLSNLTIGVVGVSGTGSIVAEQLMRLGVKRLVLVDDDEIEVRNLGRILNSTMQDAEQKANKAVMMKEAYERIGLPVEVNAEPTSTLNAATIHALSQCDILFGCLDSADGRMHLNRISTFYTIPYFDVGVSLSADNGKIDRINGSVRYVIPGASTLLSRCAYTSEQLTSDSLRRSDPVAYKARLEEKYIKGAHEGSPAVISVNMFYASLCVMEFLNRIHPYRIISNDQVETIYADLGLLAFTSPDPPSQPDIGAAKHLGRGDCQPLLYLPILGTAT